MASSRSQDDYYALLGVDEAANEAALRRAWRDLAARWHPDRAGEGATATFQRISVAYAVLSDPLARAAYDRRRATSAAAVSRGRTAVPPTPPSPAPVPAVMLKRLSGNLMLLLARGAARYEDDDPGHITLVLREVEALEGGMAMVSLHVDLRCPGCAVKGRAPAGCTRCGASGTVEELYSAWLAIPPGVPEGQVLVPTVDLPGMLQPVRFRVRFAVRQ
jgi:curved DNA-binding protein CbpA